VTGELAINTADGKLFTKKDNGTVVEIGAGGGGGGGTTIYTGTATVDFGASGSNVATVTVTTGWVTSTSSIQCFLMGTDTTSDHNAEEHATTPIVARVLSITAATSFVIQAFSEWTLTGTFKIRYQGVA
jgi:hypothetical protein